MVRFDNQVDYHGLSSALPGNSTPVVSVFLGGKAGNDYFSYGTFSEGAHPQGRHQNS